jgi:hypothetical protein
MLSFTWVVCFYADAELWCKRVAHHFGGSIGKSALGVIEYERLS